MLRSLAARPAFPLALAGKVDVMAVAVEAGTRGADEPIGKLGSGNGAAVTPDQWTKQCDAPFASVMETVEAALDGMGGFSAGQLASARLRLVVIGGLMLGLFGLVVVTGLAIRRRMSSPLGAISEALVAMQKGDLTDRFLPRGAPTRSAC